VSNYCVETKLEADAELIRTVDLWYLRHYRLVSGLQPALPAGGDARRRWRGTRNRRSPSKSCPTSWSASISGICATTKGVAFNSLTGGAVYLSPTFFWKIAPKVLMSAAWKLIAGREIGASAPRST
jgi:hypothetical protein